MKRLGLALLMMSFGFSLQPASQAGLDPLDIAEEVQKKELDLHVKKQEKGALLEESLDKKIEAKADREHVPCVMIFEEDNEENLSQEEVHVFTLTLFSLLEQAKIPVLVSASIVLNLVGRLVFAGAESVDEFRKLLNRWRVFDIKDTPFFAFIPEQYRKRYGYEGFDIVNGLNSGKLSNVTEDFLIKNADDIEKLKNSLSIIKDKSIVPKKDLVCNDRVMQILKKLIIPVDSKFIRDFLLGGHGSFGGEICGTDPKNVKALLKHFNKGGDIGVVGLDSCYSGGENLNKIELSQGVLDDYNFTLMVFIAGETALLGAPSESQKFFERIAGLQDAGKGRELDKILEKFATPNYTHDLSSRHGLIQLPQIWLPHAQGFQTFKVGKETTDIIGNVKARVLEDKCRKLGVSYEIRDKQNVLLYPMSIRFPLVITASNLKFSQNNEALFWDKLPVGDEVRSGNLTDLVFPQFISMMRGKGVHFFEEITLKNRDFPGHGVLDFIRSAFLDITSYEESMNCFTIKKLRGFNDISETLQYLREKNNIEELSDLEQSLLPFCDKEIELQDIKIVRYPDRSKDIAFVVSFVFNEQRWFYAFWKQKKPVEPWDFKKITPKLQAILMGAFRIAGVGTIIKRIDEIADNNPTVDAIHALSKEANRKFEQLQGDENFANQKILKSEIEQLFAKMQDLEIEGQSSNAVALILIKASDHSLKNIGAIQEKLKEAIEVKEKLKRADDKDLQYEYLKQIKQLQTDAEELGKF